MQDFFCWLWNPFLVSRQHCVITAEGEFDSLSVEHLCWVGGVTSFHFVATGDVASQTNLLKLILKLWRYFFLFSDFIAPRSQFPKCQQSAKSLYSLIQFRDTVLVRSYE